MKQHSPSDGTVRPFKRTAGVLLPVFSLPGKYGIGSLGAEAFAFADFLADCGFGAWQVLPLNPTSYGDSPYQPLSAYAGNPYFIDLDLLAQEQLLTEAELESAVRAGGRADYADLFMTRTPLLRSAFSRFCEREPREFQPFRETNAYWLEPYCRFMAEKTANGFVCHSEWKRAGRNPDERLREEAFWAFVQFEFFGQWKALKAHANARGLRLIGDMPIYVAFDSAEVYAEPGLFQLGEDLLPTAVAGVPPDAFSEDGQLWGNPLYRWEVMEERNFDWWLRRIGFAFKCFDCVRIDHFRGFSAYYSIPAGEKTARRGTWIEAPGKALFAEIKKNFPDADIIAEDLGILDEGVRTLLAFSGCPGMKVLQFGFGERDSEYLPRNFPESGAAYTGTHDNMTTKQWIESLSDEERRRFREEIPRRPFETRTHAALRALFSSRAELAVAPMQDFLELGAAARTNIPSTSGGNWTWRMDSDYDSPVLRRKMAALADRGEAPD